ncbi:MAG: BatD family protein, partial [Phycisphaerae bacterium]|nr:BatD family protein [Phycisphaerae bacterium]
MAAMVVLMTAPVAVAEVKFSLSPEPYYIGAPISLSIEVINEPNHDPPVIPEIKNADIRGPSKAENISMLNFKVTKTVTYNYEIFPRRLGPLVIPSIEIVVGGKARQTSPRTLNIIKADAQDLLFVEINANRKSLYLGESIALTLEIWLKPFHDRRQRFGSTADMQECIDFRGSSWGPFGESLKDLRKLSVRKQRRADAKGNKQLYYVYRLKRTWWPEKSGPLDPGEVNIIVQYPLEVHRQRSLLFNQVRVTHAKPLAMQADVAPIMVKPIPTQGQPPWYNGAVGRYKFEVTAKPTKVHVGDPITLTMSLQGAGRLELLQAPRLDKVELLVEQFKIPDEMLAGAVQGSVKRFTQTIRARSDSVEEIPPIPFTCFDTKAKKFVTLYSDPIPIEVAASGRLAVSTMVESEIGPRVSTRLTRRGEGILANYTNLDDLLVSQGFAPSPATVAWLASPPVLFLLTTLVRRRRERLKYDVAYAARRSAKSTA